MDDKERAIDKSRDNYAGAEQRGREVLRSTRTVVGLAYAVIQGGIHGGIIAGATMLAVTIWLYFLWMLAGLIFGPFGILVAVLGSLLEILKAGVIGLIVGVPAGAIYSASMWALHMCRERSGNSVWAIGLLVLSNLAFVGLVPFYAVDQYFAVNGWYPIATHTAGFGGSSAQWIPYVGGAVFVVMTNLHILGSGLSMPEAP